MDEIEWRKFVKKGFILFSKICLVAGLLFMLIGIVITKGELGNLLSTFFLVGIIFITVPPLFLGLCCAIIDIFQKVVNSGRTVISFDNGYIKELPKHCSPAICSLIYDLKIDIYKDYTATILYLCIKNYIELIKDGESYKLKAKKEKDYSKLGRCEKYVLDVILSKKTFDDNKFKEEIIKESQEKELITNNKYSKKYKILICIAVAIIVLLITFKINRVIFNILHYVMGFLFIPAVAMAQKDIDTRNTEYKRTKYGRNIALLLKGLKRYINEYTLIKDKKIGYIEILENYIPYALALGEADAVEEFIKYNENYRDLIYNGKSMQ